MNVVFSLISNSGADVTFRTDQWLFTREDGLIAGRVWDDADGDGARTAASRAWNGVGVDSAGLRRDVVETTTTAGDGDYQFAALPWDEYTVVDPDSDAAGRGVSDRRPRRGGDLARRHLVLGLRRLEFRRRLRVRHGASNPTPPTMTVTKNPVDPNQIEIGYDTRPATPRITRCSSVDSATSPTVTAADCSIGNCGSITSTPPAGNLWLLVARPRRRALLQRRSGRPRASVRLPGIDAQCPALLSQDVSASCP